MQTVEIPVVEVTVQEDRALVRREGVVTLPPGRSRLRIEGVAPVLVDKSLTAVLLTAPTSPQIKTEAGRDSVAHSQPASASIAGRDAVAHSQPASACSVHAITAQRWRVTEPSQGPEALAALEQQRREQQAELTALTAQHGEISAERVMLADLVQTTVKELSEDAGWGRLDAPTGQAALDDLQARFLALGQVRSELAAQCKHLERVLADLQRLEAVSKTVQARAAAALELEVEHPGAQAEAMRLRVDYLVPGALWRPWHRAQLLEAPQGAPQGARVRLRAEGCVWQATGEDWRDVQLWLSTERPSLGLEPPVLHTDRLAVRKKGSAVQVQTRQQQIHTAGLGMGEQEPPAAAGDELPGIDDGGQVQRLRGLTRTTIPGDGRPYRVPLFEVDSPAQVELRCMPELAPAVLVRSEQTNTATAPLLAGPVDLVRHSGLVGRTSVLYVAPGERFELGWGPDNALRVTRQVEHLEVERKTLGSWTTKPRKVRIKLSNLDASPRTIHVHERIAVSEIDKVKVELRATEPRVVPDDDGILRWEIRLPGLGRQELSVLWALVVHDDVQGL
ncbi:MAG: mucoidy inhibitor MuiA family protein [Myxococcota bacterium]